MSTVNLRWPAPAKLNLMLHITGRREDGYHELQTVFQFLDYGDELEFSVREDGEIHRISGNVEIAEDQDLVVRAAHLLKQVSGCNSGVDIIIHKNLPMGGGLGGGSSNAATMLHALNQLWQLNLSRQRLADIGLQLGADVPIFVHGYAAFAEGVGELLTPIELEQDWYLVITPDIHVSTAEIFALSELTRDSPAIKICDLFTSTWDNVCTPVVVSRFPEVQRALDCLGQHARAKMSGTGASVFARFNTETEARAIAAKLQGKTEAGWTSFVARGCNRSALIEQIEGS